MIWMELHQSSIGYGHEVWGNTRFEGRVKIEQLNVQIMVVNQGRIAQGWHCFLGVASQFQLIVDNTNFGLEQA